MKKYPAFRRSLSLMLCIMMLLSSVPAASFAGNEGDMANNGSVNPATMTDLPEADYDHTETAEEKESKEEPSLEPNLSEEGNPDQEAPVTRDEDKQTEPERQENEQKETEPENGETGEVPHINTNQPGNKETEEVQFTDTNQPENKETEKARLTETNQPENNETEETQPTDTNQPEENTEHPEEIKAKQIPQAEAAFRQVEIVDDLVFTITADEGVFEQDDRLCVERISSSDFEQAAEAVLNPGSTEQITHRIYRISGAEIDGVAVVTVSNLDITELEEAYPDSKVSVYVLRADPEKEGTGETASRLRIKVRRQENTIAFQITGHGDYDIVTTVEKAEAEESPEINETDRDNDSEQAGDEAAKPGSDQDGTTDDDEGTAQETGINPDGEASALPADPEAVPKLRALSGTPASQSPVSYGEGQSCGKYTILDASNNSQWNRCGRR